MAAHQFVDDLKEDHAPLRLGDENLDQFPECSQARLNPDGLELGDGRQGQLAAVGVVLVSGADQTNVALEVQRKELLRGSQA